MRISLPSHPHAALATVSAVIGSLSVVATTPAHAADSPPSAVAQYTEMLPTSTGSAATRPAPGSGGAAPPVASVSGPVRNAIEAKGGTDAATLRRLIESSPRTTHNGNPTSLPVPPERQGALLKRAGPPGVLAAVRAATSDAIGDVDATSAFLLVLILGFASLAAPLTRRATTR